MCMGGQHKRLPHVINQHMLASLSMCSVRECMHVQGRVLASQDRSSALPMSSRPPVDQCE